MASWELEVEVKDLGVDHGTHDGKYWQVNGHIKRISIVQEILQEERRSREWKNISFCWQIAIAASKCSIYLLVTYYKGHFELAIYDAALYYFF